MAASVSAKTLVYCSEGSPEGFTPSLYTAGTTFDASSRAIFNRLVEFERGSTNIVPALAESWEGSPDGLIYTFKLRKGVKFHTTKDFRPSRDVNADDVLYSFNRQFDPNHPDHKLSGGAYEYFNGMDMPALLKSIEKVDDHTVRFTLNKPEAPFLANLGMDFASVMSAEYAEKMRAAGTPDKIDQNPIGAGPFQLTKYVKDSVIRYKAHPDYWAGKAKIDKLIYSITPDAAVRFAKLKAGECHVMPYPNPADLEEMKKTPGMVVMEQEGLNVGYLAFNTEKKPFNDKKVRQALNYAINKQAILDAVFLGAGKAPKNPIPPTIWSYNDAVEDYSYDPDKAEAGVADEPVSALDISIHAQVLNLMMDLQEELDLAYLFISHGLSVVEHISNQVMVMYLGTAVEQGNKEQIFSKPLHPYTQALLASTPFVDPTRRAQRVPLKGELPSPLDPPSGCPFHRRCRFASDRCSQELLLQRELDNRIVACHDAPV